MQYVQPVCPGSTRHPLPEIIQSTNDDQRVSIIAIIVCFEIMRVRLRPHSYCIEHQQHCSIQARMQQYKHTFCSFRVNTTPFHTLTNSRHRHYCVFERRMMRVRLRPHTALNTYTTTSNLCTHTAIQTYDLFVQGRHDSRFIHSTNKDQRRAVIAIVVYLDII